MLRKSSRWLCAAADAERTRISHWVLYEALNAAGVGSDEPDDVSVGHFPLHNMVLLPRTPPTAAERARLKQAVLGVGLTSWTRDAHVILGAPGKYLARAAEAFGGTTIVVHPQPEALLEGARLLASSPSSSRRHVLHVRAPDPLFFLENCVEPNALRAVSLAHDASPIVDPRRSPAKRGRVLSMIHEKLQAGGTFGYWTHDVRAMHAIEDEFAHSAMTCPWDIVDPGTTHLQQPLPARGEAEHDARCHLWLRKDGSSARSLDKSRLELELRTLV